MFHKYLLSFLASLLVVSLVRVSAQAEKTASPAGVVITDQGSKLRIEIGGQLFTEYYYKDVPRPYMYPVLGPGNLPMTRNWPMQDAKNEEHDHIHHRSLWFTHGEVNGVDFWSEATNAGKIVHDTFTKLESGSDVGIIQEHNKWIGPKGQTVITEDRIYRIYNRTNERVLDFDVTLHAGDTALVLGDTKEGSMAIRLAETMRLKGAVGKGHIVNSEGVRDDATWGKRAAWCDYYGPVQDQIVGVAIFDHPDNPRFPTWWHVRDYGLFAANPFGISEFEKKPKKTGDLSVPAGKSVTFRYRFYFHKGDEKEGHVAERYKEYTSSLAPLELKLPIPAFMGTPTDITIDEHIEKPSDKPRPPFMAPKGVTNVALNKKVTSSDASPITGTLDLVTDGDAEASDTTFVELHRKLQWVQIDLEAQCTIYAMLVWHAHNTPQIYKDVVVQLADDADFTQNVRTVFNNDYDNSSGLGIGKDKEYFENYEGRLIDVKGEKGRYVRLYSKGSTFSALNRYTEVAVYGLPVK